MLSIPVPARSEAHKWDYVVPGGESHARVAARARQWLASPRHAEITIAVTHEMISRTIQGPTRS